MSKEVRINDKLWFGKYLGKTIMDVIHHDKSFLDNLVDKGKITYHQNVKDYLNISRKKRYSSDRDDNQPDNDF